MNRLLTYFVVVLIAAGAIGAIYLMFRPESGTPNSTAKRPPTVKPAQPVTLSENSGADSAPATSKTITTTNPLTASSQRASTTASAPVRLSKPLQHLAALSANDLAARDRATQSLIDQVAADPDAKAKILEELHAAFDSATSNGKLRIMYVAANINGTARINVDDPKAPAALLTGIHYLENHLNDPEISNFAPQESFTHLALSKSSDGGWVWLLDDITSSRGINLYFDPTGSRIIRAETWPKPR